MIYLLTNPTATYTSTVICDKYEEYQFSFFYPSWSSSHLAYPCRLVARPNVLPSVRPSVRSSTVISPFRFPGFSHSLSLSLFFSLTLSLLLSFSLYLSFSLSSLYVVFLLMIPGS
jgi:hypothetical protein